MEWYEWTSLISGLVGILISSLSIWALILYYKDKRKEMIKQEIMGILNNIPYQGFKKSFLSDSEINSHIVKKKVLLKTLNRLILFKKLIEDIPNTFIFKGRVYTHATKFINGNLKVMEHFEIDPALKEFSPNILIVKTLYAYTDSNKEGVIDRKGRFSSLEVGWNPLKREIKLKPKNEFGSLCPLIPLNKILNIEKSDEVIIAKKLFPNEGKIHGRIPIPIRIKKMLQKELKLRQKKRKNVSELLKSISYQNIEVNIFLFKKKKNKLNLRFSIEKLLYSDMGTLSKIFEFKKYKKWQVIKRMMVNNLIKKLMKEGIFIVAYK